MIRMVATFAALVLAVLPSEVDAARAHRAQLHPTQVPWTVYLTTGHLSGEVRTKTEAATAFMVCAASRQPIIERSVPAPIADGVFVISIFDLKWDFREWQKLATKYPYKTGHEIPYIIRADWLILQLADNTKSDAYYGLLYGDSKINRDKYLKLFGVNPDDITHFGQVVTRVPGFSPNVAGQRWIEGAPNNTGGFGFFTKDSSEIDFNSDPLNLTFKHEAEEHLQPITKISRTSGHRGFLLAALLSDANGNRQDEAPTRIVGDHQEFRGQKAIRNNGSCWGCHPKGIIMPGTNELREYLAGGVELGVAKKDDAEKIETQQLTDSAKIIIRAQEDYEATLREINGLSGTENSLAFANAIDLYDRDLDLASAAAELYCEPEELVNALAYASSKAKDIGPRLAGLPMPGKKISRAAWERGGYLLALYALQEYRTTKTAQ